MQRMCPIFFKMRLFPNLMFNQFCKAISWITTGHLAQKQNGVLQPYTQKIASELRTYSFSNRITCTFDILVCYLLFFFFVCLWYALWIVLYVAGVSVTSSIPTIPGIHALRPMECVHMVVASWFGMEVYASMQCTAAYSQN